MFLTVENYNSIENVQKRNLPNRFLESFQPDFYERTGFPSRIVSNKEIYRFLDSMHDGRLKWYYEEHNFAPIQEEFEIIKEVAQNIYSFSEGEYNKGIVVKAPMLSSMNIFRKLRYLSISEELPTIFEIGGGVAY